MFAQLRAFANRVFGLFRGRNLESRIDEELRFHIEMQTEANLRSGMDPEAARCAALRSLGGMDQVKEEHRDARSFRWVHDFVQDLRFGGRMLRRKPKFAFAAILTLALAIGPNTAFFSIIKGVQNRYLPFPDPDRLVQFTTLNPKLSIVMQNASYPDFQDYVRLNRTIESAAYYRYTSADVAGPAGTERVWAARTTASLFKMLKRSPKLGRVFSEDECKTGADPVAVISDGLWKSMFAKDMSVLGKVTSINHIHHTIIGVMPEDFEYNDRNSTDCRGNFSDDRTGSPGDVGRSHGCHSSRIIKRTRPEYADERWKLCVHPRNPRSSASLTSFFRGSRSKRPVICGT